MVWAGGGSGWVLGRIIRHEVAHGHAHRGHHVRRFTTGKAVEQNLTRDGRGDTQRRRVVIMGGAVAHVVAQRAWPSIMQDIKQSIKLLIGGAKSPI